MRLSQASALRRVTSLGVLAAALAVVAPAGRVLAAETTAAETGAEVAAAGQEGTRAQGDVGQLAELSLEELLSQQVTSAAKKPQRLGDTAAAIYVISQEQIARSGARTLSDLMRMVPGFEVSEVEASAPAVSARGFASRFAANLLVMVDGAASYGSSLAGIFWDQAIFPLQDIERIEVIRGPGGALWGSNSINGVVNIITKQGIDAQGLRADVKLASGEQRLEAGVGVRLSDQAYARVYATHRQHTAVAKLDEEYHLKSRGSLVGARVDIAPSADDALVALAEYSTGKSKNVFAPYALMGSQTVRQVAVVASDNQSRHVLARWSHAFSPSLDVTLQGYYNYLDRGEWSGTLARDLYDASLEGRWRASPRHELNFGVSGRISKEGADGSTGAAGGTDRMLTGYVQDEFQVVPQALSLIVGSKFEVNNFHASNVQPSARILYRMDRSTSLWASVSRAVRTPLQSARAAQYSYGSYGQIDASGRRGLLVYNIRGNPEARSETLLAYEAGIRGQIARGWSFDVAAFYNRYRHMATQDLLSFTPIFAPNLPAPVAGSYTIQLGNSGTARSKGFEALVTGSPKPWWHVEVSYAYLDLDQSVVPRTDTLFSASVIDGSLSSRHQLRLRNTVEVTDALEVTGFVHHVSAAPGGQRGAYTKLDLRVAWSPSPRVELSLNGLDLLDKLRTEYAQDESFPLAQFYAQRSVQMEARLRF